MIVHKIINHSIAQGSGIEPTLFIICITDLKAIGSTNYINKYADDSGLLVPETHISSHSENCKMYLYVPNTIKRRLIWPERKKQFHRPKARNVVFPSELAGIERVCYWAFCCRQI